METGFSGNNIKEKIFLLENYIFAIDKKEKIKNDHEKSWIDGQITIVFPKKICSYEELCNFIETDESLFICKKINKDNYQNISIYFWSVYEEKKTYEVFVDFLEILKDKEGK